MRGLTTIPTSRHAHHGGRRHAFAAPRKPKVGLESHSPTGKARAASGPRRTSQQSLPDLRQAPETVAGIRLDPTVVEEIARRVVELLGGAVPSEQSTRYVDASAVARDLGVERDWVYAHAKDLGAIRLGSPRGRLRFDLQVVEERLGGADPGAWQPPRRAARRPTARKAPRKPLRGGVKFGSNTAKSGRGARERPRPDTGR